MLHERQDPPAANRGAMTVVAGDFHSVDAGTDHRCDRCQHPIRVAESVRIGLGPVCRKAVAA